MVKYDNLLKERMILKKEIRSGTIVEELRTKIKQKIEAIEESIGDKAVQENFRTIVETVKSLGDEQNLNVLGRQKLWKILKHKFPKNSLAVPVGKRNRSGKIVTEHQELKHLYLKTFTQRMRNRPMKKELENLKEIKEDLFISRLKLAESNKSAHGQ